MFEDHYLESKILIVDDEPANTRLLERILQREGFGTIESTTDPRKFLAIFTARRPDIVLLDLHMPAMDGFSVLEQLRARIPTADYLPIVVLTADITPDARQRALRAGAHDFLTKPVEPVEVVLRIKNLLRTHYYFRQLQGQNQDLERKVSERTHALEQAQMEILERLARAAEYRDDETGHHAQRVGHTSALIARELGLAEDYVALLRRAAPLHDVGKIGIPDHILLKPGKLTDEQFEEMKKHTAIGAGILAGSEFPVLQLAEEIALYHHENWDGSGYMRMKGDLIPLSAQIVRAADVFDAMTHDRPYKGARSVDTALELMEDERGVYFQDDVLDALAALCAAGRLQVSGPPPTVAELASRADGARVTGAPDGHDRAPPPEAPRDPAARPGPSPCPVDRP